MTTKHNQAISSLSRSLHGKVTVPGDKSISHRSLILGGITQNQLIVKGLLEADDVLATMAAMRALGVTITRLSDGSWQVSGVGIGGLKEPSGTLDMGNTGTGTRLLMGLVASYPFTTRFTGDASLCSRPMKRVLDPLQQMGVDVLENQQGCLPIAMRGNASLRPIDYTLPVASAQIKSAILLAALNIPGTTIVREHHATRDHTERMLKGMGANIESTHEKGMHVICLEGKPTLQGDVIHVPADPSSAAFLVVAALLTPDSEITITHVCMNPQRIGLFVTLQEMGADITVINKRYDAGEEVADLLVRSSTLKGVTVPASRAPSMIDEYPILSVAATAAKGITRMEGLAELRVKESDRLQVMADNLEQCGAKVYVEGDSLIVTGSAIAGGVTVATHMDHRIAMSFLILGLIAKAPIGVDDVSMIQTSFPNFVELMQGLGAHIECLSS